MAKICCLGISLMSNRDSCVCATGQRVAPQALWNLGLPKITQRSRQNLDGDSLCGNGADHHIA